MLQTRTNNRRLLKLSGAFILITIIVIFAVSRGLNYARGPEIDISEPADGLNITDVTVTVKGRAVRVNKITLNGNPISIDENGYWQEKLVVFPGLNVITISVEDRFGRKIDKKLDLVGTMDLPSTKMVI